MSTTCIFSLSPPRTRYHARLRSLLLLVLSGSILLAGCGGGDNQQSSDSEQTAPSETTATRQPANTQQKTPVKGVCIYQGAPVRRSPGGDAKYLTSLNVGESLTFLNETQEAERGGKMNEYSKVRLKGGDKGWVRSDMIVTEAKPAAVLRKTALHERPTPMASTNKTFRAMDVVAVLKTQESWVKVRGVRRGQDWWDTGWLRPDALTRKKMDVAVASLWKKARAKEDSTERREAIKRITTNPSFKGSVFLDSLTARLDTTSTS